jgi:hypothetical protein
VTETGTAIFATDNELRAWRPDGKVDVLGKAAGPVVGLANSDRARVLALTETSAQLADVTRAAALTPPQSVIAKSAALAKTGGLVAAPTVIGGVEVIDPVVDWRWPLVTPQKGQAPFSVVDIAPDGSRVLGSNATEVFVWTLDVPDDADATKTWLGTQTNAIADNPSGPLRWP